jgi:hypothetical protein
MVNGPGALPVLLITPGILIIGIAVWLMRSYTKNKGDNTAENRKAIIGTILFVIGGVPLLIYPAVLIADAMMFDSPFMTSVDILFTLLWCALTLSYPATYVVALIIYKRRKKLLYAFAPLVHVVIAILSFAVLCAVQKR